jgi:hypothetical protein
LAARYGRKSLYVSSILGFTITSMLCGAAQSLGQIVVFRVLQGAFGAALAPLSQATLLDIYPPERRGFAMAILGMGIMVGIGLVLLTYTYWVMTHWTPDVSEREIIVTVIIQGAAMGFLWTPIQLLAFATLEPSMRTEGAALFSLLRNLGSAIGVSVAITMLAVVTRLFVTTSVVAPAAKKTRGSRSGIGIAALIGIIGAGLVVAAIVVAATVLQPVERAEEHVAPEADREAVGEVESDRADGRDDRERGCVEADRDGQRVGGVVRRGWRTQSEQQLDHLLHLWFLCAPVSHHCPLDLGRRVFEECHSGFDGGEHGHTACVPKFERAAHVIGVEEIFDRHGVRPAVR